MNPPNPSRKLLAWLTSLNQLTASALQKLVQQDAAGTLDPEACARILAKCGPMGQLIHDELAALLGPSDNSGEAVLRLELQGDRNGTRLLHFRGRTMSVGKRAFLLLKVLIQYAHVHGNMFMRTEPPKEQRPDRTNSESASRYIVDEIEKASGLFETSASKPFWDTPQASDVHSAALEIRQKLEAAGCPPILETSPSRAGYRLAVPPRRMKVDLPPAERGSAEAERKSRT